MIRNDNGAMLSIFAILAIGGCSKNDPSAEQTAPSTAEASGGADTPVSTPMPTTLMVIGVDVDTKLAMMCGLPESKAFFEFDSVQLSPDAEGLLQQLATCAKSGPAQGEQLRVIGRADPRGSDEYNQQLGMSRAESVSGYLEHIGVDRARLRTESKGESEATPDPYGWPYERRVTIRLQS